MKTSDKLTSIICGHEGDVCIEGSDEDRRTLQEVIEEVKGLEAEIELIKKRCSNAEWSLSEHQQDLERHKRALNFMGKRITGFWSDLIKHNPKQCPPQLKAQYWVDLFLAKVRGEDSCNVVNHYLAKAKEESVI